MESPVLAAAGLGRLRLENRVVLAAMTRMQARDDGCATPEMAQYYARYAREGVGLLITEATYVDEHRSRAYFNQPGMANAAHAAAWRGVVAAVHAERRPILLQLQHGGRLAEPGLHASALGASGARAAGISWQRRLAYADAPLAGMSGAERAAIVRAFAEAAAHARAAGFDGVEVHGARGYLLDEWLSLADAPLEERLAFPLEVVGAVREAFPDGVLSFNYSLYKMDDASYQPPGGAEEVAEILRRIEAAGADTVHVTTRRAVRAEAFGEPVAVVARRALRRAKLIVNGGIRTLDDAAAALQATGADFVSLARALLANPDWLAKVRAGDPLKSYAPGAEHRPLLAPTG